jgi:GrpB-like predicted nucleotidyltransferase (UPF0157 family)
MRRSSSRLTRRGRRSRGAGSCGSGDSLAPLDARNEHVGSTAVAGLAAKPVIDLQLAVPVLEDEPAHRFFRPPACAPRTVHVHVCAQGSAWERDHIRFRDLLRADPALRDEYERLKHTLAATFAGDRSRYAAGKAAFVTRALEEPS